MEFMSFYGNYSETYSIIHAVNSGYGERGEHLNYHHEFVINRSFVPIRHTLSGRESRTEAPFIRYCAPFILHSCNTLDEARVYDRYVLSVNPGVMMEFGGICDMGRMRGITDCILVQTEENIARLTPFLDRLCEALQNKEPQNVWVSLLAVLMYEINRLLPKDMPPAQSELSYIHELLQYIVENVGEELQLDGLARKFYCNRNKLVRDFRMVTRSSIHEYICMVRVARAKSWLREETPISVIAQKCGFAHESSFIRMFRDVEGMTPGEYRKSIREREPLPGIDRVENYRAAKNNP